MTYYSSSGVNLKAKLNQLPKWQNMQGAHTEIVVYEDESEKFQCELKIEVFVKKFYLFFFN